MKRFRYKDIKVKPNRLSKYDYNPCRECCLAIGYRHGAYCLACSSIKITYCKKQHNFIEDKSLFARLFGWVYPRIDKKVKKYWSGS